MCHRYWPKFQGEAGTYGDFTVTQQTFDAYGEYVVRKLSVAMTASNDSPSVVTQFHFIRWTEKDPPRSPVAILDVVQEVNAVQMASGNKPIDLNNAGTLQSLLKVNPSFVDYFDFCMSLFHL